jgi:hypothetical protein
MRFLRPVAGCRRIDHRRNEDMKKYQLKVLGTKRVRRVSGSKKEDVIGGYSKYHNEELHNLYSSRNIITVMKSRVVKWAGHVRMSEMRNACNFLSENLKGRD